MSSMKTKRVRGAEEVWDRGCSLNRSSQSGSRSKAGSSSKGSGFRGTSGSGVCKVSRLVLRIVCTLLPYICCDRCAKSILKVESVQLGCLLACTLPSFPSPILPLSLSPYPQSLHTFHHISTYLVLVALDIVS